MGATAACPREGGGLAQQCFVLPASATAGFIGLTKHQILKLRGNGPFADSMSQGCGYYALFIYRASVRSQSSNRLTM